MTQEITIVDCGRGPQLSTCRITVLDLVRYFRKGSSPEEIIRWISRQTYEWEASRWSPWMDVLACAI